MRATGQTAGLVGPLDDADRRIVARIAPFHRLVSNRYYIDDLYLWIVKNIQQRIAVEQQQVSRRAGADHGNAIPDL